MWDWSDANFLISQGILLIGYTFLAITFFIKDRKLIFIFVTASIVSFIAAFYFLGAWSGFGMYCVLLARSVVVAFTDKHQTAKKNVITTRDKIMLPVWLVALTVVIYFTADTFISWFSFFATVVFLFSIWQKNILTYRWLSLLVSVLWIVYTFYVGAMVSVGYRAILFVLGAVGVIMYYKKKRERENANTVLSNK